MSEISATLSPEAHHAPVRQIHPLGKVGRYVSAHRKAVVAIWLILTVLAAPLAVTLTGVLSGAGWDVTGSESEAVRNELRAQFPTFPAEAAIVVVQLDHPLADGDATYAAVISSLTSVPGGSVMFDPLTLEDPSGFISADGQTVLVPVKLAGSEDADLPEAAGDLIAFVDDLAIPGATIAVTGEWPMWSDFNETNEAALHRAELLSGVPSLILLFLAFGSAIAAGLPLLLAIAGIAFGFGTLYLLGVTLPVSVWAMNFSMMIGLAVGIDYSLFIVSRYREERWQGRSSAEAIENALSTAGFAVLLSALSVIFSLAVVFIVPVNVFRSMAIGMILSVTAVAVASLTLLPAVLLLLGDRVLATRSGGQGESRANASVSLRDRQINFAFRRPGLAVSAGALILGALLIPALGMRLGMPDARVVDEGHSSRDGYELLTAAFGPGAAAPLYMTVDAAEAETVVMTARDMPDVLAVAVVTQPNDAGRVVIQVTPTEGVSSTATMDLVAHLRAEVAHDGPSALVGGPAGQQHDLTAVLTERAPWAVAIIMIGAFLMLLVIFRSVLIGVVSVALNLASVAAAFGFATIVFQHGYGTSLLHIESQGFVDAWAPIFFFALLFGLSMDYQLFLLAAIRERFQQGASTIEAARDGITRTAKPITNAAAIMIVVFIAFGVTGPIPPTELGITLAFAVLLDATLIRMILMPAILALLGERTWWLPRWLDDRLPEIEFKH